MLDTPLKAVTICPRCASNADYGSRERPAQNTNSNKPAREAEALAPNLQDSCWILHWIREFLKQRHFNNKYESQHSVNLETKKRCASACALSPPPQYSWCLEHPHPYLNTPAKMPHSHCRACSNTFKPANCRCSALYQTCSQHPAALPPTNLLMLQETLL